MMARIRKLLASEKEAWIRFALALTGLALSFTAAVFSTVERMAGNLVLTVILASASLLMAAGVAITTVPYLARKVRLERVRDVFDYDVTREGAFYLVFTLIIGIAALNTGNNLLFIIVSAMLAAIIVSGIASAAVLRALELEVVLPRHAFARSESVARLKLVNKRKVLPAFSVAVVATPGKEASKRRRFGIGARARKIQDGLASNGPVLQESVYFPYVPAKGTVSADVQLRFERRGRYTQDQLGLMTRFPFALFRKTRRLRLSQELIVYPAIEATDEMLEVLPALCGEFETFVRGRGYDLYRIRDHVPEDSARHVDWKATAKTRELKVREFTREDERKLRIVFDNPVAGMLQDMRYERAVSLAASLAWHFSGEGTQLCFVGPALQESADTDTFLKLLALMEPADGPMDLGRVTAEADWFNVVVTARTRGSIPTELWAKSYFVFMGD